MKNYISLIKKNKRQFTISKEERFVAASSGTNYKVYLSNNHVIRFRDDNPKLLLREANFLKQLNHALIPKVLRFGKIGEIYLRVKVRPGANASIVKQVLADSDGEIIKIDVAAPAVKGRANQELIKFLAQEFEVSKNNVKISGGAGGRLKLVRVVKTID